MVKKKEEFRDSIKSLGDKAIVIMQKYFEGKPGGNTQMARIASKTIGQAIKIEHMDQIKGQNEISSAIRIAHLLPKDQNLRNTYIKAMIPGVRPLLMARPRGGKK